MRILDDRDTGESTPDTSPDSPEQNNPAPVDSSQPDEAHGFGPVLKNRRFLVLWSGQIFSQLADKVYLVLMIA